MHVATRAFFFTAPQPPPRPRHLAVTPRSPPPPPSRRSRRRAPGSSPPRPGRRRASCSCFASSASPRFRVRDGPVFDSVSASPPLVLTASLRCGLEIDSPRCIIIPLHRALGNQRATSWIDRLPAAPATIARAAVVFVTEPSVPELPPPPPLAAGDPVPRRPLPWSGRRLPGPRLSISF